MNIYSILCFPCILVLRKWDLGKLWVGNNFYFTFHPPPSPWEQIEDFNEGGFRYEPPIAISGGTSSEMGFSAF